MIGFLQGTVHLKTPEQIVILAGGVGYELLVPASTLYRLPALGEQAALHVSTYVREDTLRLYGFSDTFDKTVFEHCIGLSGVGPRLALALMGPMDGRELAQTLVDGRTAVLQAIPGVGKKTAERLVLEAQGKMQKLLGRYPTASTARKAPAQSPRPTPSDGLFTTPTADSLTTFLDDLRGALLNLGYKDKQVSQTLKPLESRLLSGEQMPIETALRHCLRELSGGFH